MVMRFGDLFRKKDDGSFEFLVSISFMELSAKVYAKGLNLDSEEMLEYRNTLCEKECSEIRVLYREDPLVHYILVSNPKEDYLEVNFVEFSNQYIQ